METLPQNTKRICQYPLQSHPGNVCGTPLYGNSWKWCRIHALIVIKDRRSQRSAKDLSRWRQRHGWLHDLKRDLYRAAMRVMGGRSAKEASWRKILYNGELLRSIALLFAEELRNSAAVRKFKSSLGVPKL